MGEGMSAARRGAHETLRQMEGLDENVPKNVTRFSACAVLCHASLQLPTILNAKSLRDDLM